MPRRKDPVIHLPDLRQSEDYDCGATVARSVCRYFGVGTNNHQDYLDLLRTTPRHGTRPRSLVRLFRMLGLHVQMRSNMGVAGLDRSTRDGWPVVCPIRRPPAAGHWVAVTGVTPRSILVYDPSAGHCAIDRHDWLACWRDSADGVEYVRLGISVGLWR